MIEKEFVPYEEALALEELEFDEPCFAVWFTVNKQLIQQVFNDTRPHDKDLFTSAPTFSQAFRWFREKFNLHHEIEYNGFEYLGYVSGMTANIFKTYEEAELACLRKLIEIVK